MSDRTAARAHRRRRSPARQLLERERPSFEAWHVREPDLVFARGGRCQDPKAGISLFGPLGLDKAPRRSVRVAVIGSPETTQRFKNWLRTIRTPIAAGVNSKGKPYDPLLAPDFPGAHEGPPLECSFECTPNMEETIPTVRIAEALAHSAAPDRIRAVVSLFCERLSVLAAREPEPDVVVCAPPPEVEDACRRQFASEARDLLRWKPSKRERAELRFRRRSEKHGQELFEFGNEAEDPRAALDLEWDFHNSLKARAMEFGLPTQLIWNSTLDDDGTNQDPATIAWNLAVGLYYKAGNLPWSLDGLPHGTCFVGISFYKESRRGDANVRTALAQVFSETGEGLVLRGGRADINLEGDRQPHLSEREAEATLCRAIELYQAHFGQRPVRVVVHKTSRFNIGELRGMRAALQGIASFDLLALQRRGIRFFRMGYEPPVRGTVVQLGRRDYLLYTRGYLPSLRMYPGMRVPTPLEVVEHHGDSSAEKVCSEILALTKLNWNSCAFANADPITIAFAKQVGAILRDLPEGTDPQPKYRFYM